MFYIFLNAVSLCGSVIQPIKKNCLELFFCLSDSMISLTLEVIGVARSANINYLQHFLSLEICEPLHFNNVVDFGSLKKIEKINRKNCEFCYWVRQSIAAIIQMIREVNKKNPSIPL